MRKLIEVNEITPAVSQIDFVTLKSSVNITTQHKHVVNATTAYVARLTGSTPGYLLQVKRPSNMEYAIFPKHSLRGNTSSNH